MDVGEAFGKYLEKRAEELGLPTDPKAYQDGGLAEATAASNIGEADLLVALFRSNGIPAWVNSPLATLAAAEPVMTYSVLVPLGRLGDARSLLAEHAAKGPVEDESESPARPTRSRVRTIAGIIILGFGVSELFIALTIAMPNFSRHGLTSGEIVFMFVAGVIGLAACVIGIRALRRPRQGA
jgi:hypothetical protein